MVVSIFYVLSRHKPVSLQSVKFLPHYNKRTYCDVQTNDLYDNHAVNNRYYFYTVDNRGNLFLHNSKYKNIATAYRDSSFLKTFYKSLRINNTGYYTAEFPYVSPCGKEINYVYHDDANAVITFTDYDKKDNTLLYGGNQFAIAFDPRSLVYNLSNGRLYHNFTTKYLKGSGYLGLLHPQISDYFSDYVQSNDGDKVYLTWNSELIKLRTIQS